jgi:hypothetical protein
MRSGILRSAAHNVADSFASGMGFPIGVYQINIFKEAAESPAGYITVDFLRGAAEGGPPSPALQRAIKLYRDALPNLLGKQNVALESFRRFTARFSNGETQITIEDDRGRHYVDDYVGSPLRLRPVVDQQGRVRRARTRTDAN